MRNFLKIEKLDRFLDLVMSSEWPKSEGVLEVSDP
jgi:hypothetical protein